MYRLDSKANQSTLSETQSGFTLVELITVIVVLGILAAAVLPRFINIRSEAIIASMQRLDAAIETATTLTYAKAVASGLDQQPSASITLDGESVDLIYGFPAGTANGIAKLVDAPSEDWKQRASTISGAWVYWHGVINEDAGSAGCYIRYRQSTNIGRRPVVDFVSGGCPTAN